MDDVETAKVISLVILFAGSFILGLLPIWVGGAFGARNSRNRCRKNSPPTTHGHHFFRRGGEEFFSMCT